MTMFELIQLVSEGRWFKEPSPFRCIVQTHHPKLCVITGPNVSGKSLLRKVLQGNCGRQKIECIHLSQAGRCESGIVRALVYGDEREDSTGKNSVSTFLTAIKTGQKREHPFVIVFDEPEIGCSEELQMAVGLRLARDLDTMPNMVAAFVISHSRQLVRHLLPLNPTHWRLSEDGMTLQQWTEREILPIDDLDSLNDVCHKRWSIINNMMNGK